jgi:hypothetical protein
MVIETRSGVWGKAVACDKGLFFVGKDGIYGFDGINAVNLGKKIWPGVETENPTRPDNFDNCSLAFHNGFVWVSFPAGTNQQVLVFDPDHIYDDDRGDSHAPMYPLEYTITTGYTSLGFDALKEYNNRLFGVNNDSYAKLFELDYGGYDESSGGTTSVGINWAVRQGFHDYGEPTLQKTFRQVTIETNEGIAIGSASGAYDFQLEAAANFSTGAEHYGLTSAFAIDLEYTTDVNVHVSKTLDIPASTDGYVLDGNALSIGIIGETSGLNGSSCFTTDPVNIYGFKVDWDYLREAQEEVSS